MRWLKDFTIVIPTRGRVERQVTLRALPRALLPSVVLITPANEYQSLAFGAPCKVIAQDHSIQGIAEKRAWIVKSVVKTNRFIMLDDDMSFYARGPKGLLREYATDAVVTAAFKWVYDTLTHYAHAGISSRLLNDKVEEEVRFTARMMHAIGYNRRIMLSQVIFNRVKQREDFDYTLQLLRAGWDNAVLFNVCVSPGSYGAPGGCDLERTVEISNVEALKLAALHPGLVKVVDKDYKGVPRKEVIVSWRKALNFDKEAQHEATRSSTKLPPRASVSALGVRRR